MNRSLHLALLTGIVMLFSSCATIVSKKPFVSIISRPAGAIVSIIDKKGHEVYSGKSPVLTKLKPSAGYFSKASYTVNISYPGYEEKKVQLNYGINGWYFGNILLGGLIGMLIVDPITGHMWTIKNPIVDETLVKLGNTTAAESQLNLLDINDITPEMKAQLVKLR